MRPTIAFFFVCSIVLFNPCSAQVEENADASFSRSSREGKPLFLIFSGSDWCAPCMRFEKRILSDPTYQDFARQEMIVLKADFPQRKKLPEQVRLQNEGLAEKYNPTGAFPHLVLIAPESGRSVTLSYSNETPTEFIALLRTRIQHEQHADSK